VKLKGDFFSILKDEGNGVFVISLNPSHTIYKAHFPEIAITPGVILVRIATELFSRMKGKDCTLVGAPMVKFSSPVYPSEGKTLRFAISEGESGNVQVRVTDGDTLHSKMSLEYEW